MKLSHGQKLWLGLALYVVLADGHAVVARKETLSSAWGAAVTHRRGRLVVIPIWVYLSLHLHKLIPSRYDPLRRSHR